mgnify:CR=1 FL=1|jgi:hypothetical protein
MSRPPARPIHPALLLFLGLFGVAGGVPITYLGAAEIGPEIEVRTTGTRTQAKVTDTRIMKRRRSTSYGLRYRFKFKGKTYTVKDATGSTNLWTGVPEDEWRKAKKTGTIPILFLKRDPWHNRPVNAGLPLGDKVAGLGLGLTVLLGGLFALGMGARNLVRRRGD